VHASPLGRNRVDSSGHRPSEDRGHRDCPRRSPPLGQVARLRASPRAQRAGLAESSRQNDYGLTEMNSAAASINATVWRTTAHQRRSASTSVPLSVALIAGFTAHSRRALRGMPSYQRLSSEKYFASDETDAAGKTGVRTSSKDNAADACQLAERTATLHAAPPSLPRSCQVSVRFRQFTSLAPREVALFDAIEPRIAFRRTQPRQIRQVVRETHQFEILIWAVFRREFDVPQPETPSTITGLRVQCQYADDLPCREG